MVEKIIFTTENSDDAIKDLQGGQYPAARNILPFSDNSTGVRRKNVPGTIKLADLPVSNTAICIHAKYYPPVNKSFFFFHDLTYGHSIVEYDGTTKTASLVLRNAGLNFSLTSPITRVNIVGDLIYFNDGYNKPRKINYVQAKAGLYNGSNFSEAAISQIRRQPIKPPEPIRATDPTSHLVNDPPIKRISFQFALRYLYIDGEYSALSPISRIIPASRNNSGQISFNFIQLTLYIDKDIKPFTSSVELLVRTGNTGNWFIYDKLDPSAFSTVANDPVTGFNRFRLIYNFYNDKSGPVLSASEVDPFFYNVPRLTNAQELTQDRLFETDTLGGEYDLEEPNWNASVQIEHITDQPTLEGYADNTVQQPDAFFGQSRYGSGLVFFDLDGRRTAVSSRPGLEFTTPEHQTTHSYANSEVVSSLTSVIRASIQPTGLPPVWAYWVAPARTANLSFQWWVAQKCKVQFPRSIQKSTATVAPSGYYLEDGYEYYNMAGISSFPAGFGSIIDISLSADFPFAIDDKILVHLAFDHPRTSSLPNEGFDKTGESVIQIIGNKIRIKNPISASLDWTKMFIGANGSKYLGVKLAGGQSLENNDIFMHFLLVRPNDAVGANVFWEIGELHPISNPGLSNRAFPASIPLHGDCYAHGYTFFEEPIPGHTVQFFKTGTDHQKTIMYSALSSRVDKLGAIFLEGVQTDQGKPTTDVNITEERRQGNVVRWSNPRVPDSLINGLSEFLSVNKFPLPSERGDVNVLIASGRNTLLAIHAGAMTTLFVGQRVLKSPSGSDAVVSSDDVIGYQDPLSTDLGCINPESVVSVDGFRIYGFDFNNAEPWRKSQGEVVKLATVYKKKKWFRNKVEALKAAKAIDPSVNIKIVGGIDPFLDMFFLTFQKVQYTDNAVTYTIPAETVGFSELLKGWVALYDFLPERYVNHEDLFLSVKNQKLWQHNADKANCNKFYDVQYSSEITIAGNMQDDDLKQWDYLSVASNGKWKVIKAITPDGQETDMNHDSLYKLKDDRYYVEFLKNKNTPASLLKVGQIARLHGVPVVSDVVTITLRNSDQKEVVLDAVYVGYSPINGHLMLPR